ncbi:YegP family protein [Pseudomonas sp.]|uniref:YegP family protein n=1 Tax=Pseudomonas sp. TaxID=306 RepID=UPI002FCC97FF
MSARYEIFRGTNQQYYFRLKAPNNEIILQSEGYVAKSSCQNGIQSAQQHSPYDRFYVRQTSTRHEPFFVLRAANNHVIGVSEAYSSTQARENGIDAVKRHGPSAGTVDLT